MSTAQNMTLIATPSSEIQTRSLAWLIPNFVPDKMLTVFASIPGVGKGLLAAYAAAHIQHNTSGTILWFDAYDSDCLIATRLKNYQANFSKIYLTDRLDRNLIANIEKFKQAHPDLRLVIVDPTDCILSNRGGRQFLMKLALLAEEQNFAVILTYTPSKSFSHNPSCAWIGSWLAVPRIIWKIEQDATDQNKRRLTCLKSHICKKPVPERIFTIGQNGKIEFCPAL